MSLVCCQQRRCICLAPIQGEPGACNLHPSANAAKEAQSLWRDLGEQDCKVPDAAAVQQPLHLLKHPDAPLPPQRAQNEPHKAGTSCRLDDRTPAAMQAVMRKTLACEGLRVGVIPEKTHRHIRVLYHGTLQ